MKTTTKDRQRTHQSTLSTASPEEARRDHAAPSPTLDARRALSLLSAGGAGARQRGAMTLQRLIGNRATNRALQRSAAPTPSLHQAAHDGVRGGGGRMPHFDTIQ